MCFLNMSTGMLTGWIYRIFCIPTEMRPMAVGSHRVCASSSAQRLTQVAFKGPPAHLIVQVEGILPGVCLRQPLSRADGVKCVEPRDVATF